MLIKFDKFNEESIGYRMSNNAEENIGDDKPSVPFSKRKIGYKHPNEKDIKEPDFEPFNLPSRLKNRAAFTMNDVMEILLVLQSKSDTRSAKLIENLLTELFPEMMRQKKEMEDMMMGKLPDKNKL